MLAYQEFQPIQGVGLNLDRLGETDLEEAVSRLYSPTTWVVAHRGMDSPQKVRAYLAKFIEADARGEALTLVARVRSSGEVVAISRFHSAPENFLRVEIGYTWIADRWMRTFVNTEKKYLMLRHAFEAWKVKRVEFSVDPINEKSNRAMKRLGAVMEGTLRKWRFLSDQDQGHRNIYSILDDEWEPIRGRLERMMGKDSSSQTVH